MIGAAAKILASTLTYPYQVVKSRLQQRDPIVSVSENILNSRESCVSSVKEIAQPRYTGTLDCVQKVWRWEIVASLSNVLPSLWSNRALTWQCSNDPRFSSLHYRNEGILGFFRGVIPNALKVGCHSTFGRRSTPPFLSKFYLEFWSCIFSKVAPSAALTFLVYEECLKLLVTPLSPGGESAVEALQSRFMKMSD